MIKSKILTAIRQRLGNRTDSGIDTLIDSELDFAQYELERGPYQPWFLLSEDSTASTTALEPRLQLPSDFLAEYEEGALYYRDSDSIDNEMVKDDLDNLKNTYKEEAAGEPERYAIVGDYYYLFPTPLTTYTMLMKYYQSNTLPSDTLSTAENLWMKHAADLLTSMAGARVAAYLKDTEAAALFEADRVRAATRLYTVHVAREEANRSRYMGEK